MSTSIKRRIDRKWDCIHEKGNILWSSNDQSFKCKICNEKFIPKSKIPKFILRLNKWFKWF